MRKRWMIALLFVCCISCLACAQDLQMQAPPPQAAVVGQDYSLPLTVTGGIMTYSWKVVSGDLPPGLRLQQHKGAIVGIPTTAGTYHFTIAVADSSIPQQQLRHDFNIQVIEGLSLEWKDAPAIHGNKISGSTVITNQTGEDFVLTVVVVAVNEIGRATALGYQHFKLAGGATSPVIPFGSSPGLGTYYVRIDATAHRPGKKHIFRASKQTPTDLKLSQL
ncbi:MAG TPA: Ig domain-containing protein [Terriglobales bacterium]|jgi:hypothetical protein